MPFLWQVHTPRSIPFSYQIHKYKNFMAEYKNFKLKLTSHDILHYLFSVDLSKSFSQLIVSIFLFSIFFSIDFARWKVSGSIKKLFSINFQQLFFLNIFFNKFCPVEKCVVTPHCLYRDSLTLMQQMVQFCYNVLTFWVT